jgi:hypothetical protein
MAERVTDLIGWGLPGTMFSKVIIPILFYAFPASGLQAENGTKRASLTLRAIDRA